MPRNKKRSSEDVEEIRPALSLSARENQMISLAEKLAEQKLLDGTANSQIIVHYLKLGSSKERIEKEIMERQKDLITAKTKSIESSERIEELFRNAMEVFRGYAGNMNDHDDDDETAEDY